MFDQIPPVAVPIHALPDPAFVFRYLVVVHAVTCYIVLAQNLALKLRPNKKTNFVTKVFLAGCVLVPLIQLPLAVTRIVWSLTPEFCMTHPTEAYLNFFWSPMCTIYLVWLVQMFMATRCKTTMCRYEPKDILCTPSRTFLVFSVFCGVVYSHLFYAYLGMVGNHDLDLQLRITAFVSLVVTQFEMAFHHGNKTINLVPYGLTFFMGTWLYFLRFV